MDPLDKPTFAFVGNHPRVWAQTVQEKMAFGFIPLIILGIAGGVTLSPATASNAISLTNLGRQTCHLTLRNDTKKPVQVWMSGFWPNHRISMLDSGGKPVALTPLGKSWAARFGSPSRDKNAPFEIKASEGYD